jgi:hypothetical protein
MAFVPCGPKAAFGVDRCSVRAAGNGVGFEQRPHVAHLTACDVVVIGADDPVAGVGEIHRAIIGAPAQGVRHTDVGEDAFARKIFLDPVQRAAHRKPIVSHRPNPQPARAVALAVVETVVLFRRFRFDERRQRFRFQVEFIDAGLQTNENVVGAFQYHCADQFGQRPLLRLAGRRSKSLQRRRTDIDPEQAMARDVPHWRLAERVETFYRAFNHVDLVSVGVAINCRSERSDPSPIGIEAEARLIRNLDHAVM